MRLICKAAPQYLSPKILVSNEMGGAFIAVSERTLN